MATQVDLEACAGHGAHFSQIQVQGHPIGSLKLTMVRTLDTPQKTGTLGIRVLVFLDPETPTPELVVKHTNAYTP